jgi:hypothetical protein
MKFHNSRNLCLVINKTQQALRLKERKYLFTFNIYKLNNKNGKREMPESVNSYGVRSIITA